MPHRPVTARLFPTNNSWHLVPLKSVLPKVSEAVWSQGGVSDCVFDAAVTEVSLNCSGVVTVEGEVVAAGVAELVRVDGEIELCSYASFRDNFANGAIAQRRPSLAGKDEGSGGAAFEEVERSGFLG